MILRPKQIPGYFPEGQGMALLELTDAWAGLTWLTVILLPTKSIALR